MIALLLPTTKSRTFLGFGFLFNLAATYSRGGYTTTTIGKAAFDGRVRNGIGSVHSFMTTKNLFSSVVRGPWSVVVPDDRT